MVSHSQVNNRGWSTLLDRLYVNTHETRCKHDEYMSRNTSPEFCVFSLFVCFFLSFWLTISDNDNDFVGDGFYDKDVDEGVPSVDKKIMIKKKQ